MALLIASLLSLSSHLAYADSISAESLIQDLTINELMASNGRTVLDEYGDYDDWIELRNNGDDAVDVAGCYLSDDPADPAKWRIPATDPSLTTVPTHGYLLVWADDEAAEGLLHANFKLSAGGETVVLSDAQMNLLDSVAFGVQAADTSYARFPDGTGPWQVSAAPTPGQPNGAAADSVVISEIMYHPYHPPLNPEDTGQEWIELLNRGDQPVDLAGWTLADGVDYVFPNVVLDAGEYLVVAADVQAFLARYGAVTNVVGGWTGRLSNSGERLALINAAGIEVDSVEYADQGDWAVRELGPTDKGHRGWQWSDEADGGGKSLELIDAAQPNEFGQNWAASLVDGGTPGRANSVAANGIAPMIADVRHTPLIPGPADPVTVTTRLIDGTFQQATVRLHYRVDQSSYSSAAAYPHASAEDFISAAMFDDGAHGDGQAADGVYAGQIPAHPDGVVMEFYVTATDEVGRLRTWPAPSLVDGQWEQVTNALYRVDGELDTDTYWQIGGLPLYYVVMTEMERGRLAYIGSRSNGQEDTVAAMNATFISIDGTGAELRYRAAVRNRGHGTRTGPPNNYHVSFPSDETWKGVGAINFNCRYTHVQILGSAIFHLAGISAADTAAAELRINGADLAYAASPMYGVYVRLEAFDDDFAKQHFPDDPNGNLYACFRDNGEADLRYRGTDPNTYRPSYFKESNASQDDWSDLIHLVDVLNNAPEDTYLEEVGKVINIHQWLRYIAVDSLLLNYETGLNMGIGDDYFMYRGVKDPRFVLIPHDLDTILDQGNAHASINLSIFSIVDGAPGYNGVDGLQRLFDHPDIRNEYYAQLVDLTDTIFSPERFNPLVDQVLGAWLPESLRDDMKQFVVRRNAAVLAQIPQEFLTGDGLASGDGNPLPAVPRPQLCINEVLAINDSAVELQGMFPDLVELYYDGPTAISLSGMSLTDDPQQPAKFVFPAGVTMNPGDYLVLSADSEVAAPGYHLGFGLNAEGDGIYLYDPSGVLMDSVEFGTQLPDLSIGRIGADGSWHLTVPTFGQPNLEQPVGDSHGLRVNEWLASEVVGFDSDFIELYNPDSLPVDFGEFYLTDTPRTEPGPHQLRPLSFIAGEGYAALTADGRTDVGHLDFKLSADGDMIALFDADYRQIDGVVFPPQTTDVSQGRAPDGADPLEFFILPTPGLPNGTLPQAGATTFSLVAEDAAKRVIVPTSADEVGPDWNASLDFDDSAWESVVGSPGGVGYESSTGYESLISLNLAAQMHGSGKNNTCYIRIPFTVAAGALADIDELVFKIRYDDGYVAYLNGVEVARSNFTGVPEWNSYADSAGESIGPGFDEYVDLSSFIGNLKAGGNLLAIQGMNGGTGSSDMLILAALDAASSEATGGDYPYADQLSLLEGLRVTELMYNAPQGDDLDYIELRNVTNVPLDLTGVRFTAGIDFSFPSMVLDPGQSIVVVGDLAAFQSQYGTGVNVVGQYAGHLSNGGEDIVLKLAPPFDAAILRFRYADTWYPTTDGGGDSLHIQDAMAPAITWDAPENWRADAPSPGMP